MPNRSKRQQARSADRRTWTKEIYLLHKVNPCIQALSVSYNMIVTKVRFKVLIWWSVTILGKLRSFSFNGHAHNALPPWTQNGVRTQGTALRLTPRNMQFPRQPLLPLSMPSFTNCNLLGFLLSLPIITLLAWYNLLKILAIWEFKKKKQAKAKHIYQNITYNSVLVTHKISN